MDKRSNKHHCCELCINPTAATRKTIQHIFSYTLYTVLHKTIMTDTVPLNVKWNKDSFNVNFVVAGGVKGLKNELEEKTGVPADRMKLMAKSKG
jgi:hypothetical protein